MGQATVTAPVDESSAMPPMLVASMSFGRSATRVGEPKVSVVEFQTRTSSLRGSDEFAPLSTDTRYSPSGPPASRGSVPAAMAEGPCIRVPGSPLTPGVGDQMV